MQKFLELGMPVANASNGAWIMVPLPGKIHVIEKLQLPTLVISHNKTLAAQLYEEFKGLFPENAVEYFVSYYDYYQPEAYIAARDIYIEKDASRNDDLERLRLSTTTSLSHRKDVVIVSSVSCIFGLGSPDEYKKMVIAMSVGQEVERHELLRRLVALHYKRNDIAGQQKLNATLMPVGRSLH